MSFIHRAGDGAETDVTEGVQALYDLVISSMDWGSGFWSWEDALPVAEIGRLGGFEKIDEVERYVAARRHEQETEKWRHLHQKMLATATPQFNPAAWLHGIGTSAEDLIRRVEPVPHDHVFSSVGRCMWPRCNAQAGLRSPRVVTGLFRYLLR
jgi:hypothetical protein